MGRSLLATARRCKRPWTPLVVRLCLGLLLGAVTVASFAPSAAAQTFSLDFGDLGGSVTNRVLQLIALLTVLSLAPSILMMMTCFTRIVIALSFLRTALGTQSVPPNTVMISLALFLTFFVMAPVFERSYRDGILPFINEEIDETQAFERTVAPLHRFMMLHTSDRSLGLFFDAAKEAVPADPADTPLHILIPAFMISELKRAFEMGFLLFLPFLVIDMVVASILMSMGMMMLPPTLVGIPFKIIFFVLVDGWYMIAGSLIRSFESF